MLQVLINHDAGRLRCCHCDTNALANDVIYGLGEKRNANISRFGGRKKLKPGSNFFLILNFCQIKKSEIRV